MANEFETRVKFNFFIISRFKSLIFQIALLIKSFLERLFTGRKIILGFFSDNNNNKLDSNFHYIPSINLVKFNYPKLETNKIEDDLYRDFFKKYRSLFFKLFNSNKEFYNLNLEIKRNLSDVIFFFLQFKLKVIF